MGSYPLAPPTLHPSLPPAAPLNLMFSHPTHTHTQHMFRHAFLSTHPFRRPAAKAPHEEVGRHRELEGAQHHDL